MTTNIIICVFALLVCIIVIAYKLSGSTNTIKPQTVSGENLQLYNDMLNFLHNYEIPSNEELKEFSDKIEKVTNENDKDVLDAVHQALFFRKNLIIKGGELDILLNKNEELVYKHKSTALSKIKTVSTMITGVGSRYSKNGIRSFVGNVSAWPNQQMVVVEPIGTTYLTNKRIIFKNPNGKTHEIKLNSIIDYAIENNAIVLSINNGNPIKITVTDNFLFYKDESGRIFTLDDSVFQFIEHIRLLKNA